MGDARLLPGLLLVAFAAAAVLVVLLVTGVSRAGVRRAGLVSGALPLALLPPVAAAAYGCWKLEAVFEVLASQGGVRDPLEAFGSLWAVQRVSWGAFVALSVVGLLLAVWRSGRAEGRPCSARRAVVLLLIPVLALAVASLATRPLAAAVRVSSAVISSDPADAASQKRLEAVLESEGLPSHGSASIGSVSRFVTRSMMTGLFGAAAAALVLLGLALPGFILAWPVRFGATFAAAAAALWGLAALGAALVAFGVLDPVR